MALHERDCFADRAGLARDALRVHPMVEGRPPVWRLEEARAIFFGGSGAYSVLDPVDWIQRGLDLLVEVAERGYPAYASCFGFQGLALALGGVVQRDDERTEMGAAELTLTPDGAADPLFGALPARFWAQEGHHDRVVTLPEGVVRLATGAVCPEQAFRVQGRPFWASQFHPELTRRTTLDRFEHYLDHYVGDLAEAERMRAQLRAGQDSPEVPLLLQRLVQRDF